MAKGTLKNSEVLAYGAGTCGSLLPNTLCATYVLFYSTEVLGLDAAPVGLICLLAGIVSCVVSLALSARIDRVRTRFGVYRPFLLAAIPFALLAFLLFAAPGFFWEGAAGAGPAAVAGPVAYLWVGILYVLCMGVLDIAYWCAFNALPGVMSAREPDRLRLVSIRTVFEYGSALVVTATVMPVVLAVGESYADPAGWRAAVILPCVVAVAAALACFLRCRERVSVAAAGEGSSGALPQEAPATSWVRQLSAVAKSRALLLALGIVAVAVFAMYAHDVLMMYLCTYDFGAEDAIAPMSVVSACSYIAAALLAPFLLRRMGLLRMMTLAAACIVVAALGLTIAADPLGLVPCIVFKSLGLALVYVGALAMIPALADEVGTRLGHTAQGLVACLVAIVESLMMSVGELGASLLVGADGYRVVLAVLLVASAALIVLLAWRLRGLGDTQLVS